MKKKITLLVFSLSIVVASVLGQSQRMVLAEEFTSTTCGPCAAQNPAYDILLENNLDKVVSIKYHMSWPAPGNDPFYLDNQSENNNRRGYYTVNSVPHVQMDGSSWSGQPQSVNQNRINSMYAVPAQFDIQTQTELSAGQDTIFVTTLVKATADITNNLVIHNVVTERFLHFNSAPGNNGEKDFYNVMKKMLPSASGTQLDAPMSAGDYVILQNFWVLDYIYDIDQLEVVTFIQSNLNKEVSQTALSSEDALTPVYSLDAEILSVSNVTTTNCFGTLTPKITIRNNGQVALTDMDIEYTVNGGDVQSASWAGNLNFLETAEIELSEISFDVLESNTLQILGINPNSSTDDYEPNNTFNYQFEQAPNLSGGVNLFMIFDNNPEETTWELVNSAGEIVQSGGPYDTPNAMKIEPLDVSGVDCFELLVYDAGGNGMCCNDGDGYYAVIYGSNQTAFQGNSFGDLDRNQFNYDAVGIKEEVIYGEMSIYPNPVNDILNIKFDLIEDSEVDIQVYDLLGKKVYSSFEGLNQSGSNDFSINLEDLDTGFYLLKLTIGENSFARKISVN